MGTADDSISSSVSVHSAATSFDPKGRSPDSLAVIPNFSASRLNSSVPGAVFLNTTPGQPIIAAHSTPISTLPCVVIFRLTIQTGRNRAVSASLATLQYLLLVPF